MWTPEIVVRLIKDMQFYRCLWDVRYPDYKDRNKKTDAIAQLSINYNVPPAAMQKKLRSLRTQFRREHKKIIEARHNETSTNKCTWFGYEPMMFLLSNYSKGSKGSDTEDIEEIESDEDITCDEIDIKNESIDVKNESIEIKTEAIDTMNEPNNLIQEENSPRRIETFQCMRPPRDVTKKRDSLSIFSEFVADSLRNCNRPQGEIYVAQHQINQIIFRLQMGGFASENQNRFFQSPSQSSDP